MPASAVPARATLVAAAAAAAAVCALPAAPAQAKAPTYEIAGDGLMQAGAKAAERPGYEWSRRYYTAKVKAQMANKADVLHAFPEVLTNIIINDARSGRFGAKITYGNRGYIQYNHPGKIRGKGVCYEIGGTVEGKGRRSLRINHHFANPRKPNC